MSTVAYVGNVGKNFGIAAGCAIGTAMVTAILSRIAHQVFSVPENKSYTPSVLIREGAVIAALAGCYHLLPNLPLTKLPVDRFFLYIHTAFVAVGLLWFHGRYCRANKWESKVTCLHLAALCAATPLVGQHGQNALPVVCGIGALAGSFI